MVLLGLNLKVHTPLPRLYVHQLQTCIDKKKYVEKKKRVCEVVCQQQHEIVRVKRDDQTTRNLQRLIPFIQQGSYSVVAAGILGISTVIISTLPADAAATSPFQIQGLTGRDFAIVGGMIVAAIGGFLSIINKAWMDQRDKKLKQKAKQLHQDYISSQVTEEKSSGLLQEGDKLQEKSSQYYSEQSQSLSAQFQEQEAVFQQMQLMRESIAENKVKQEQLQQHIEKLQSEVVQNSKPEAVSVNQAVDDQVVKEIPETNKETAAVSEFKSEERQTVQIQKQQVAGTVKIGTENDQVVNNEEVVVDQLEFKEKPDDAEKQKTQLEENKSVEQVEAKEEEIEAVAETDPEAEPLQTAEPEEQLKVESEDKEEEEEEEEEAQVQQNVSISYQTGWGKVILHGSLNGGQWEDLASCEDEESETKILNVDLSQAQEETSSDTELLQFVLTNGEGDWDNCMGNNYHIQGPGKYIITSGQLTQDPSV
eukprot:TRINITY_DN8555_c0_g1_i4.p1 TRINITY_DN8555_c0_g1~~TRINITY_DN8555_c0_g1_i4.p1  ORF type:complete len:493 (-),score=116.33 TRINITY_DN8555_c0_g1_i4:341-1777(-)